MTRPVHSLAFEIAAGTSVRASIMASSFQTSRDVDALRSRPHRRRRECADSTRLPRLRCDVHHNVSVDKPVLVRPQRFIALERFYDAPPATSNTMPVIHPDAS